VDEVLAEVVAAEAEVAAERMAMELPRPRKVATLRIPATTRDRAAACRRFMGRPAGRRDRGCRVASSFVTVALLSVGMTLRDRVWPQPLVNGP